ncbi:MAG: alpha/beta fold hydrolase [Chloroflexota bacterium]|nr:alpha/beta fold hydrolase [Chloroflexota bacterium]
MKVGRLWRGALVGSAIVGGYVAACAWLYHWLTRVPPDSPIFHSSNTPPAFLTPPLDTGPFLIPDYEAVGFPSRTRTVAIGAWWMPVAGRPDAPAVIAVHGYTASRRDERILLAAGMLHRHGFAVLAIDLRNHGESGRPSGRHSGGVRESADVLGAWDWLVAERRLPAERVGLFGISLGAASVLIAAGDEPEVAAVWADSSYGDMEEATRAELGRNGLPAILLPGGKLASRLLDGPGLRDKSPLQAMDRLTGRSVYITHGTEDTRLDVHYAHQLVTAGGTVGARTESWIVAGSGHADAIVDHPVEYERRLVDFFARSLEPTPATPAASEPSTSAG